MLSTNQERNAHSYAKSAIMLSVANGFPVESNKTDSLMKDELSGAELFEASIEIITAVQQRIRTKVDWVYLTTILLCEQAVLAREEWRKTNPMAT